MSEVRELLAVAAIGKDAEEFLKSDLGRTVLGIADEQAQTAMEKLKTVSSWRRSRIRDLQAEIWRAESFGSWLRELMTEGEQALHQLEEKD